MLKMSIILTLHAIIKKIIIDYTGSSYLNINKALTSTNPLVIAKMSYYLQFFLLNHRKVVAGDEFYPQVETNGKQKLCRNIHLDKKLISQY